MELQLLICFMPVLLHSDLHLFQIHLLVKNFGYVWLEVRFFCFLVVRIFRKLPKDPKIRTENGGMLRSYLTTVVLTLTNPVTIFAFLAVFAALGLDSELRYFSAAILVAGVFIGSCLWFFILSSGTILFRNKLDLDGLKWVNKIAGILIIISSFIAFGSLL
ncbi:MAG: LysE family translocator [Ignavibacteriales bacterium]|nr:LysE family translocator [Ignavibacteriales bacterium]